MIEGFYGPPWSQAERLELFGWMRGWGLNTYFYAPKDDLKHRAIWRELYTSAEEAALRAVVVECERHGLRFIYGLGPGLDIRYSHAGDMDRLRQRFEQLWAVGARHFAVLFDDIPDRMDAADLAQWGSLASAQAHVANGLQAWTRERAPDSRFLFCPTPYCGRMASRHLGGEGYLAALGRELHAGIDVFWTGPEIISATITRAHAEEVSEVLRRKPLIWDNLHANDYDGRRFFCGPYAGRDLDLRTGVSGILCNPNTEFPLNFVPLRTFGDYLRAAPGWDPRASYLAAIHAWLPQFETVSAPLTLEDLTLLGDCHYLPHADGAGAAALLAQARRLLATRPAMWGAEADRFRQQAGRLRDTCARVSELRQRALFHALSRRVWELREELDLLDRCIAGSQQSGAARARVQSDFHLPGTYRGGLVARLQQLLVQQSDGTLVPADDSSALPAP